MTEPNQSSADPGEREEGAVRALTQAYGRSGRGPGDEPGPDCLTPEQVAALVGGALTASERAAAEAHLADCDRCAAEVGSVLSVAGEKGRPVPGTRRVSVGVTVTRIAAVAVAAAMLIGVPASLILRQRAENARVRREIDEAVAKVQKVAQIYHLSPYKRATLTPEVAAIPVERVRGPADLPLEVQKAGEEAAKDAEAALAAIQPLGAQRIALQLAAAELEAERGRHQQALDLVQKALADATGHDHTRALILKATILLDRSSGTDADDGVTILDDLLRQMESGVLPMDPDVYYNRAMYDQVRGDTGPNTRALWEHYLRKEPDPKWRKVAEQYLKEIPDDRR